ncbi:MAG: hypothetical protein AAGC96_02265 [Pseudomonadota bacterium]
MPELPVNEQQTAIHVCQCLETFQPTRVIQGIGGYGVATMFHSTTQRLLEQKNGQT